MYENNSKSVNVFILFVLRGDTLVSRKLLAHRQCLFPQDIVNLSRKYQKTVISLKTIKNKSILGIHNIHTGTSIVL